MSLKSKKMPGVPGNGLKKTSGRRRNRKTGFRVQRPVNNNSSNEKETLITVGGMSVRISPNEIN
jgi:hypothetical protein